MISSVRYPMSANVSAFDPQGLATAGAIFLGFVGALFVASRFVPATQDPGVPLAGGARITYTLNGFRLFLLVVAAAAAILALRPSLLATVHEHFWPLFAVANVAAFAFTAYLTVRGRAIEKKARPGVIGFIV